MSAVRKLAAHNAQCQLILIDHRRSAVFLPLLPDIIGRNLSPYYLTYPLADLARRQGFAFLNGVVERVDLAAKKLVVEKKELSFDYLLIAAGTETNFYGNELLRQRAYKVDDVADTVNIRRAVLSGQYDNIFVAGGGYTGLEVATNIERLARKRKLKRQIFVVESGETILGTLPQWMKDYAIRRISSRGITYFLHATVADFSEDKVTLADGTTYSRAMLIWTAGVRVPELLAALPGEKTAAGRLVVDRYLRLNDHCFVAGDCAAYPNSQEPLRLAARFAIQQGRVAAGNIINSIKGKQLKPYRPFDWGYLVPLADNSSCGIALGLPIRGFLGILLHYFVSLWLTRGWRNRLGLIKDLLLGGLF